MKQCAASVRERIAASMAAAWLDPDKRARLMAGRAGLSANLPMRLAIAESQRLVWSDKMLADMKAAIDDGLGWKRIGKAVGVHATTAQNEAFRRGWRDKPSGRAFRRMANRHAIRKAQTAKVGLLCETPGNEATGNE